MSAIITQAELDSLVDPKITKVQYDFVIEKISIVFYNIMVRLKPSIRISGWVDFNTCDREADDSNGYFDPVKYKDNIHIYGDRCELSQPYGYEFPTRWLTMSLEDVSKEYDESTNVARLTKDMNIRRQTELKKRIVESVKSKLTSEELKYIQFKF